MEILEKLVLGALLGSPFVALLVMLLTYNFGYPDPDNNKAHLYAICTLALIVGLLFDFFGWLNWYVMEMDFAQAFLANWYFLKNLSFIIYVFASIGFIFGFVRIDTKKSAIDGVGNFLGTMLVALISGTCTWLIWYKLLQPVLGAL